LNRLIILIILTLLANTAIVFAQTSFTAGGDITVDQNSGAFPSTLWATNIVAVTPSFEIQSINLTNSLTFAVDPAIDASGNITFEPNANRSGTATVTVALRDLNDMSLSIPATFKIFVTFINTPPTFVVNNADQTIDEKSDAQVILGWATDISPGPNPEEVTQQIIFSATVASQSAFMTFIQAPEIDPSGTLSYELSEFSNGSADIDVILTDDGLNTPPSSNISDTLSFTITINPINDPPSFTLGSNIQIDEHTGVVLVVDWATNISAGAPDEELSQNLTFVVTENSITDLLQFNTPVGVDANGNLSFQATPHYHGTAVYEIYLQDDGLDTLSNNNRSAALAFTVTVDYINDAPSFTIGEDITMDEGDNTITMPAWATNISPGSSPDEQDQALHFTVVFQQVTGSIAFLRTPEIDDTGLLIFRATEHTHGEAIFDVYLTDNGEFESPHENTSPQQSFSITVNRVNFPPNDLLLNNTNLLEKLPSGSFIGTFTTSDLDPEDSFNYNLVPGEGSDDNDSFTLDGDGLLSNEEFDFDTKNSYTIRVKTSDGEFSLEKSFTITIDKLIEGIKFANAITPNGDGENDTWEIEDIEAFPDVTVFIYDTAGQNVYKSRQGYTPWDGTFNGRQLPMGTYYYVIDLNDGINVYKGTITIIL